MKAILMLSDMPKSCYSQCPFHRIYADNHPTQTYCSLINEYNDKGTTTRLDECPLFEISDNTAKLIEVTR